MHQSEEYVFNIDNNGNIDESAFVIWKAELEKNLPGFWRQMK